MISLEPLKPCLQGIIPSSIFTASKNFIPNVAYLSHVHYVDDTHIALTMQYFNKTLNNLKENPTCMVRIIHPDNFKTFQLTANYKGLIYEGNLFEEMSSRLMAIADYSGGHEFFKLQSVVMLEVVAIELIDSEADTSLTPSLENVEMNRPVLSVSSLQQACEKINSAETLDELFDSILQSLDLEFGFRHSMILLADGSPNLSTIATRGYNQNGVGSEILIGSGVIGRAALTKQPLIHSSLVRDLVYARSVNLSLKEEGNESAIDNAIPFPGLPDSKSQIAIPLLFRSELLGVLFAEANLIWEFKEEDQLLLKTLGSVLAMAIYSLQLSYKDGIEPPPKILPKPVENLSSERMLFTYYAKEDCLFMNGEYLIRSVPARILWRLLKEYKQSGKKEFNNRELRLDPFLQLPEFKDNLEARLILLRKRLEKKSSSIKLLPVGRGKLQLAIGGEVQLEEV